MRKIEAGPGGRFSSELDLAGAMDDLCILMSFTVLFTFVRY